MQKNPPIDNDCYLNIFAELEDVNDSQTITESLAEATKKTTSKKHVDAWGTHQ